MFTGIVKGLLKVNKIKRKAYLISLGIVFPPALLRGLEIGASVAVDGVCLTVVKIDKSLVWFDVIEETLVRSTLKFLEEGDYVNIERAAKFGKEIGGHILSGHVFAIAEITKIDIFENNKVITLKIDPSIIKYFFPKGFIGLDGLSLTLVDVSPDGHFSVHLIPETLRSTKFGFKKEGDKVNVEIEASTQAIVDTAESIISKLLAKDQSIKGLHTKIK